MGAGAWERGPSLAVVPTLTVVACVGHRWPSGSGSVLVGSGGGKCR
jgi:hypothetical protein